MRMNQQPLHEKLGPRSAFYSRPWAALLSLVFLLMLFPLFSPVEGSPETEVLKQKLQQQEALAQQAYSRLQSLQKELAALETKVDAAAQRLADLDTEIRTVEADIDQAQDDLEQVRLQLENRLVNMYKRGSSWSAYYVEAMLVEEDLSSVLERFDMVTKLADLDKELFDEVESYLGRSRDIRELLEQKQAEQEDELLELQEAWEQVTTKRRQAAAQYKTYQSQAAAVQAQIRRLQEQEAAVAAAAAARMASMNKAAKEVSDDVGAAPPATTPTTSPASTPTTAGSSGGSNTGGGNDPNRKCPTNEAEIRAQATFIERTWLIPRKSVLTGRMIMDLWIKYDISPAESLTVLSEESGMGSTTNGGRLVTEGNNFGCMTYMSSPKWLSWPPAIGHGKIFVGGRAWMKFYSVEDGIEAWGRYIANGLGRDYYRPLMKANDWVTFAWTYYGKNVPGCTEYIKKLYWTHGMLTYTAKKAGYYW